MDIKIYQEWINTDWNFKKMLKERVLLLEIKARGET